MQSKRNLLKTNSITAFIWDIKNINNELKGLFDSAKDPFDPMLNDLVNRKVHLLFFGFKF